MQLLSLRGLARAMPGSDAAPAWHHLRGTSAAALQRSASPRHSHTGGRRRAKAGYGALHRSG